MSSFALNHTFSKNLIKKEKKKPFSPTSELEPYLRFNLSLKWGLTPDLSPLNLPAPARVLWWNPAFISACNRARVWFTVIPSRKGCSELGLCWAWSIKAGKELIRGTLIVGPITNHAASILGALEGFFYTLSIYWSARANEDVGEVIAPPATYLKRGSTGSVILSKHSSLPQRFGHSPAYQKPLSGKICAWKVPSHRSLSDVCVTSFNLSCQKSFKSN